MLQDPESDLANTRRKDLIKTVIIAVLFILGGIVVLDYAIGDPMERPEQVE